MADDAIIVDIRAKGAARTAREVDSVSRAISSVGRASSVAAKGVDNFRRNMALGATASYALKRGAFVAGASVAGLGVLSIKTGIQFNASMEQNQVAFTKFLGSAQAARTELAFLYKTAAVTPFETQNITEAARKMLAFGFSAKSTNKWLTTIGDTISGIGGGPAEIDRLTLVLGQIKSKGRLQGDELMQLNELGVVNQQDLARRLGTTPAIMQSGNAHIPAAKALAALQAQWAQRYGGMAAQQAKTFNGQMSTLHDNISMTLGKASWPLFVELRDHVIPDLNAAGTEIGKIFDMKGVTLGDKLKLSESVLRHKLAPFAKSVGDQIKAAHLPERLGEEFNKAAPHIANGLASAGWMGAKAFASAFMHSGVWGKVATLGFIGWKTGAIKGVLSTAIGSIKTRGSSPANPLFVADVTGGGFPGMPGKGGKGAKGKGSWLKRAAPWALLGGVEIGAITGGVEAVATGKIPGWVPGLGGKNLTDPAFGGKKPASKDETRVGDWIVSPNHRPRYVGNNRLDIGRTSPRPAAVHVYVDGKEVSAQIVQNPRNANALAKGVAKQAVDARARRGR